jgi:hypothetical protein
MSSASGIRRKLRLVDFYRGRCAKTTALKWIKEGKLRAYRLDGMTFVDETFDEFIERQAAELEREKQNEIGGGDQ